MSGKKYEHQLSTCLNRVLRTAQDVQDILLVMKSNESNAPKDQKMEVLTVRLRSVSLSLGFTSPPTLIYFEIFRR